MVYGPWWDACLLDWARMGRDLRHDLTTVPAMDVCSMVRGLVAQHGTALRGQVLGDAAGWGAHEENTARLLDILEFQVAQEWADRTADPDDDEVRRARADAKRRGIKPPPDPPIAPVAQRPVAVAEERIRQHLAARDVERHQPTGPMFVSRLEFERRLNLK